MADTNTVNYNWVKPDIGASDDTWGGKLNTNFDGIDSIVHGIDATALRDAPNNVNIYGRKGGAWTIVAAGVVASDTPPASPSPGALWWDSAHGELYVWYQDANSSQWVSASNQGGQYLLLAGGTLTGDLVLPAVSPATPASAVPKTYVDATNMGYVNKLRNGTFDVWQRGTSSTITPALPNYTADGWYVTITGSSCTVQRSGSLATAGGGFNSLTFLGATGITGATIRQRIESNVAGPLRNQQCTLQFLIYNSTSVVVTPSITISAPTALDDYTSITTIVGPVAVQSCPSGPVWTQCAYTFTMPSTVVLGLQVLIDFGGALNGPGPRNIYLSSADLRATPGVPVGLNANPPPPELRPIHEELAFCQRYFETSYGNGVAPGTVTANGINSFSLGGLTNAANYMSLMVSFKVPKRVPLSVANIVLYSPTTGAAGKAHDYLTPGNDVTPTVNTAVGVNSFLWSATSAVSATSVNLAAQWTASAEL